MKEFLIKRTGGDWFDLPVNKFREVLRPNTLPCEQIQGWGDHRIRVSGLEVSFSCEDPGIHVCFEAGSIDDRLAVQIVREVLENITRATHQHGDIVHLT